MSEERSVDAGGNQGGQVIQFPTNRTSPPPLPRLPRAIPTPGSGASASPLFGAALTRRFDREAA